MPTIPPATFEVASIRMVNPASTDEMMRGIGLFSISPYPANQLTIRHATFSLLLSIAFRVDSGQIANKPDWIDSQQYDVVAKVEGDRMLTHDEMVPLVQHLLEQRFHLTVHQESKLIAGYALVIAKGGPKLQPPINKDRHSAQILSNSIQGWGASVDTLAGLLRRPTGDWIVNKTGIAGTYDYELNFAPLNDPNSSLPNVFTALREQLGLKLVPQKVPIDMLVIDHVDKIPTEN